MSESVLIAYSFVIQGYDWTFTILANAQGILSNYWTFKTNSNMCRWVGRRKNITHFITGQLISCFCKVKLQRDWSWKICFKIKESSCWRYPIQKLMFLQMKGVYEGGSKSPCNHLFSLHRGAFVQRWQCLHQVWTFVFHAM